MKKKNLPFGSIFPAHSGTTLKKHTVIYSKWKLLDSIYCFLILEIIQYTILTFGYEYSDMLTVRHLVGNDIIKFRDGLRPSLNYPVFCTWGKRALIVILILTVILVIHTHANSHIHMRKLTHTGELSCMQTHTHTHTRVKKIKN